MIPGNLDMKLQGLADREIAENGLSIVTVPGRGRSLHTTRTIAEGDDILTASCLIFTGMNPLMAFLSLSEHEEHRDAAT